MKHGHTVGNQWSREYRSYRCMLTRCYDVASGSYVRYGGAGIQVAAAWRSDFRTFLRDVRYAPSDRHQLDRIDSDGHYEPGNVRWVTAEQNNRTRRNRSHVILDGQKVLLTDAVAAAGHNLSAVKARITSGWSPEDALSIPNDGSSKSRDPIVRALQLASVRAGINWSVVRKRIHRGWEVSRALSA